MEGSQGRLEWKGLTGEARMEGAHRGGSYGRAQMEGGPNGRGSNVEGLKGAQCDVAMRTVYSNTSVKEGFVVFFFT